MAKPASHAPEQRMNAVHLRRPGGHGIDRAGIFPDCLLLRPSR
jgi:hypothetical protein